MLRTRFLAVVLLPVLAGCSAHVIETRVQDTVGAKDVSQSTHSLFSTNDPVTRTDIDDCPSDLIERVKIRQSFGQKLVSLLTLGLRDSVTVEVTCKNVPSDIGSTDE